MSTLQPAQYRETAQPRAELPARRRGNGVYLAIWSILGLGATAYLVLIALGRPLPAGIITDWNEDDAASVTLRKSAALPDDGTASGNWSRMSRDLAILKTNVAMVSQDVKRLDANQQKNVQRVERLEAWQNVVVRGSGTVVDTFRTGQADSGVQVTPIAATPEKTLASNSAIEGTTLDGVTRTAPPTNQPITANEAASQDAAILAALLDSDPEAAASVGGPVSPQTTTPLPTKVPPEPAVASQPIAAVVPLPGRRTFGVELGSGDSVDSLRLTWALLNERHRNLVGALAPRYVRSGAGENSLYRLIAGPFSSSNRARELCTQLQAYYVSCQTSAFTGSVL